MLTAHNLTILSRVALAMLCAAIGFWAVDPFQMFHHVAASQDRLALGAALYMVTVVGGAALPKVRRNDIALMGVGFAGLLESLRAIIGGDASFWSLAAAVAGVAVAWAPGAIEQLRRQARTYPFLSFRQVHDLQRRGKPVRTERRGPNRPWAGGEVRSA